MITSDQDSLVGRALTIDGADPKWEQPLRLGHFALPRFPLDAFPTELCAFREFCAAVAKSYQVPVDLPAMLALSVAGAALSKKIVVKNDEDWSEPVNLFVVVAMQSGERKSAVFREMTAPLAQFEADENLRLEPEIARNRAELDILGRSLTKAQEQAARAVKSLDRQKSRDEAMNLAEELCSTTVLRPLQLIADDATPEAVSRLLYEQDGRLAILAPEGDLFDIMLGRYSRGEPNLGGFLMGHAGAV